MAFFLVLLYLSSALPADARASKKVVATILPVYIFAKNVAGDKVQLRLLIPPGTDVHDFYLRPGDVKALNEADLILINGGGVDAFIKGKPYKEKTVDTSAGIELIRKGASSDPHIWLSPRNAAVQVKNIKDALIRIDPPNKASYEKNAVAYIKRLLALDSEINNRLSGLKKRYLITYHESFNYFAKRYGLAAYSISGLEAGQAGPGNLRAVYDIVKKEGIPSIFTEKGFPGNSLERLRRDMGVRVCELDTIETGPMTGEFYETAMRENLFVILKCLGRGDN